MKVERMTSTRSKIVAALVAGCLLAGCAAAQQQVLPAIDAADPLLLNEQAVRHAQHGNLHSARILLERAALLAPHDATIARNLQLLGAAMAGQAPLPPARPPGQPAAKPAATAPMAPAPPALWSVRQLGNDPA